METKPMKLSAAILLGSTMTPQAFGYTFVDYDGVLSSCALGAALLAIGYSPYSTHYPSKDFRELSPWKWVHTSQSQVCPQGCGAECSAVINTVVHLNDRHRWTRERIAEWVAKMEPKEENQDDEQTDQSVSKNLIQEEVWK